MAGGGEFFLGAAANAVGTLMVDYLVKPIERRIRYLFRFTNLVEDLHQQQNNLNREQSRVKEDVKEAKLQIQTQVIEDCVSKWLTDAEEALEDAGSLDSRIEENKRCCRWCPNWSWRYQLSKEIERKTKDISKLVENSHFERIGHRAELSALEFIPSKDLVPSKSQSTAFNQIIDALKDDKIKIMGVWGMGGVGKTTLVKKVGAEVKGFDRVIFVTVSATPENEKIQNEIADSIDLKFEKKTEEGKAKELCSRLKDGKFLMILDDLWDEWDDEADLNKIGIPLAENGKGCTLILTTRSRKVCKAMNCQPIIAIDVLDSDEAWDLFRKKAKLDEKVSRDILEEAKKVAEECKGLPVAIVPLATALKDTRSLEGWELARKKLENNRLTEIVGIKKGDKNAYVCIKTSYDYLQERPRRLFFLCALYPEDHSIDAEDLVRYAWGLELYEKIYSVEEVRTQVLETIDYLKDSSLLLQDGDEGDDRGIGRHVKLHDLVRDVALWITSKEESGFMIKSRFPLLNNGLEPCNAISLLDGERKKFPEKSECPKLELMLLNNCDVQGLCFQRMQELKVLSLRIEKYSGRMISLYALQFLKKLRSLHLVNFEDFTCLGNLRRLEIFSLRDSGFIEKSSKSESLADELRKLENLKILDLADFRFSNGFPADVITRLSKLEELYLRSMEGESTAIFQEINFLTRLTTLSLAASSSEFPKDFWFPKLRRYDICINTSGYSVINARSRLQVERSLIVEESSLNLVSRSLENIEFLRVLKLEDECLIDKRQKVLVPRMLQNLKEVRIENCENLKVAFQNVQENVEPLLCNLKFLLLNYLPKLSHIWELPIQHVRLEALVELRISSCRSLKSVFSISLAQSLVLLENLDIGFCDELKQIVNESEGDEEEISSSIDSPSSLCFPKLRKVHIAGCDGLDHIFPTMMAPQGLPQLEHLSVHYCRQLKQLVRRIEGRTENDVLLQQLQFSKPLSKFSVVDCPLLRDSFVHLDVEVASFEKVRLSAFKESLFNSQKHLQLSEIIEGHNLVPEANEDGLNGLNSLRLEDVKDVECLVDNTTGNGPTSALTHLEMLSIICLPGLETLCKGQAPQGFLKNLRELTVEKCSKLQVVFQIDDLPYRGEENQEKPLSDLQSLKLVHLHGLRWIVKGSAVHSCSLQSLKVVEIKNCRELESLFSPSLTQSLVMLEKLWISDCDRLKTLITELENNDGETESNTSLPMFLPKLKHLYIIRCPGLQYALPITLAKGLPSLAIISVSDCGELKQVFGTVQEQNGVEQNVIVRLGNLRHLKLCFLSNLSCFAPQNYIFKAPDLEGLEVDECPRFMNFTISQVDNQLHLKRAGLSPISRLYKANDLHLDGWEVLESLVRGMQEVNGLCMDFLRNNKKLIVTSFEQLREVLGNDEENQAPPLLSIVEHLKLESLPELRWIVKVPTHSVIFQSLLVLEIDGCNQLKFLFSLSAVQTVMSLQQLKIRNCKELECVFMELKSCDDDKLESSTLQLPNLKTVDISWCRNAKYVFPLALAGGLPRLQNISLVAADNLCSFFPEYNILEAPALENLIVSSCPQFRSFIVQQKANKSSSLKKLAFNLHSWNTANVPLGLGQMSPGLEYISMGDFEQLFQLQGGYSISGLEDLSISYMIWLRDIWKGPTQFARNLRELSMEFCHGLTYIFPMMLIQNLPHLKHLGIRYCEKLEQIIGNDDSLASSSSSQALPFEKRMEFPQLEGMSLWGLPSLVSFSPLGYHLVFPSLKSFRVENCSKMITSFMMDYVTLVVHAKTEQGAPPLNRDIDWKSCTPFSLSQYVEEVEGISTSN